MEIVWASAIISIVTILLVMNKRFTIRVYAAIGLFVVCGLYFSVSLFFAALFRDGMGPEAVESVGADAYRKIFCSMLHYSPPMAPLLLAITYLLFVRPKEEN